MGKFKPYFEIDLPKEYSPEERRAIAAEIIDSLITRTEDGKDKNGKGFKSYSDEYKKNKGQSNVDLTFSGDMLSAIELLSQKSGKIRIGYQPDYEGVGKVEGNVLGTYGQSNPKKTKPRDFLGVTDKELKNILSNYPIDDKQIRLSRVVDVKAADVVATELLNNVGLDAEA
jgi:hypothetical protein